jgi:adenosylcobinamide hydrolase
MKRDEIGIEFKRAQGYKVMVVRLPGPMRVLSTTVLNGAYTISDTIIMVQVPLDYSGNDPESEVKAVLVELGLSDGTVCFMTAADMEKVITVDEQEYHGCESLVIATAGVKNAVYAGELIPDHIMAQLGGKGNHTINIMVILGRPLHDIGLANAIITTTEAKTAALMDCGVRGTGTTSDAVAIVCPIGEGEKYAGTATDAGICLARAVRNAVKGSTLKWYARKYQPHFLQRLDDVGVTLDSMWQAALTMSVPDPRWSEEVLMQRFKGKMLSLTKDVNVNALVQAAIHMDDMGRSNGLCDLEAERYLEDPAALLADEMMGMGLAEYINGTKGVVEYLRYDRIRPGITSSVGPFLDDVVSALSGSVMSLVCTELQGEWTSQ